LRKNLFPRGADLSWRALSSAIAKHLRFERPNKLEAWSYNLLQRLSYLFVIFVLFPLVIWTGLAMSPAFVSAIPATVTVLGGQQSAHDSLLRIRGSPALPADPHRHGLACRIQDSHGRDDNRPATLAHIMRKSTHERSLTPQADY
jgi:hypothetical protein